MQSHETMQVLDKIESCLEVIGSAINFILKPERNIFSAAGHEDFGDTLTQLKSLTDDVMLCVAYNDAVTYALPFKEGDNRSIVLSLPDYNLCSKEWNLVCEERISNEPNFKETLENEVHWRKVYGRILIEYLYGACSHRTAMSQLSAAKGSSKASFEEAYNFLMDMSPKLSLVAFYKNSVVELVFKDTFDDMEIITHHG